jgi:hypothetical protein
MLRLRKPQRKCNTHALMPKHPSTSSPNQNTHDFKNHLARYHTPAPMATLIIECLEVWYDGKRPTVTLLPTNDNDPNATLHRLINEAYNDQCAIGWGHFL